MKFAPVALLALAAGVQASNFKHAEPGDLKHAEPGDLKHAEPGNLKHAEPGNFKHAEPGNFKHAQPGNFKHAEPAPHEKAMHSSPSVTGTMPVKTGFPGRNSTVAVTTTAPCHKCTSTPLRPTSTPLVPSSSGRAGGGGGGGAGTATGGGATNTPVSPSATGVIAPNPGAKITVPMAGAALGSVAYGLMFLA